MIQRMRLGLLAVLAGLVLSGCTGMRTFETYYSRPADPAAARQWRLEGVDVLVPATLTVSEAHTFEPEADIVWREDPIGDRRKQVAAIMTDAVGRGAAGLKGSIPVRLAVEVTQFHALTLEAEAVNWAGIGVHNINFVITVVDARSGARLAGPEPIDASLPAMTGTEMIRARLRGESQKSQISNHVAATIAGWLGLGPDQRGSFVRAGR
jgi:hypothetical protein